MGYNAFIEDLLFGTDQGSRDDPDYWINQTLSPQGFASMIGGAIANAASNAASGIKKAIVPVQYRKAETKEEFLEQKKRKAEKARKKKCSGDGNKYKNPDQGVKGTIKNLLGMCNGNCPIKLDRKSLEHCWGECMQFSLKVTSNKDLTPGIWNTWGPWENEDGGKPCNHICGTADQIRRRTCTQKNTGD